MSAEPPEVLAENDARDLYREIVLRHAKAPHNYGRLPSATHHSEGVNMLCGDKLALYLEVSPGGRIDAIRFDGTGCAISLASASLMTETVKHQHVADALAASARFCAALDGEGEDDALSGSDLAALTAVKRYPSRVRCATLAWRALDRAVAARTETTE